MSVSIFDNSIDATIPVSFETFPFYNFLTSNNFPLIAAAAAISGLKR